jgi:hypothetical protein
MAWLGRSLGLILFLILTSIALIQSVRACRDVGAVDFRNRVVATRQAQLGHNPYTTKWTPDQALALLDPVDDVTHAYTRLTSPPFVLTLLSPIAHLDYTLLKHLNFALSWLAFFVSVGLLAGLAGSPLARQIVLGVSGCFALSEAWMFHLDRGQQYIYFVLLLLVLLWAGQRLPLVRNVLVGLTPLVRPSLVLVGFALCQDRRPWRAAALALLALVIGFTGNVLQFSPRYWLDYGQSARSWYLMMRGEQTRCQAVPCPYPEAQETGVPLCRYQEFHYHPGLYYWAYMRFVGPVMPHRMATAQAVGVLLVCSLLLFLKRHSEGPITFFLEIAGLCYLLDLFLPAPRAVYNDVLALGFVPLLLSVLSRQYPRCALLMAGLVGLLLIPPGNWLSADYQVYLGLLSELIWALLVFNLLLARQTDLLWRQLEQGLHLFAGGMPGVKRGAVPHTASMPG